MTRASDPGDGLRVWLLSVRERHLGGTLHRRRLPRRILILPVEVCVIDDLFHRRGTPLRLVTGGVGVRDQGDVVSTGETTVDRGPDAGVRLRTGDDDASGPEALQDVLEDRALEGVAVGLGDQAVALPQLQLGDELPLVGTGLQVLRLMLDPDDRHVLVMGPVGQFPDVGHDLVAAECAVDDEVLQVDDEQRRVRSVGESTHDLSVVCRTHRVAEERTSLVKTKTLTLLSLTGVAILGFLGGACLCYLLGIGASWLAATGVATFDYSHEAFTVLSPFIAVTTIVVAVKKRRRHSAWATVLTVSLATGFIVYLVAITLLLLMLSVQMSGFGP